jgi:hypothetical protein
VTPSTAPISLYHLLLLLFFDKDLLLLLPVVVAANYLSPNRTRKPYD